MCARKTCFNIYKTDTKQKMHLGKKTQESTIAYVHVVVCEQYTYLFVWKLVAVDV